MLVVFFSKIAVFKGHLEIRYIFMINGREKR